MCFSHLKRFGLLESLFGGIYVWKEIVISEKVPDRGCPFAFDSQNAQETIATLELENQIITGSKGLRHVCLG